jgi:hypothetical protein
VRSHISHILTFSHSLNQPKERARARNRLIMIRKPPKGPKVTGQLSEKARGTLHKRSRTLAITLRAFKLRRQKKLSKKVVPDPAKDWSATRVKDQLTGLVSFVICGPTKGGDTFEASIPAEQRDELNRVRKTLRRYEAALPSQVDDALEFIEKLFDGANVSPRIATSKPGFTDTGKGFVLGPQMLGDAVKRYLWLGEDDSTLGQTSGTREGWNEEVGKLLQYSSFATIAVLTVLASPVPDYIGLRKSEDPRWRPAVSEPAIFNFAGESASGKTLAISIAASLSGDPGDRGKWDFSRRGVEEFLHTRNHVGAIFDDVEKHTGESMPLRRAIATVTQSLPDGASKIVSRVARDRGLPPLKWSIFGLSSSPRSIQEIAREEGWIRSLGEQVRLIDECVPPSSQGGIIDVPPPGTRDVAEFSRRTAKQMERGVALHFGHVMPAWIEVLLADDHAGTLLASQDHFVKFAARSGSGYDARFASKFGLLYAAGRHAVKYGVLPLAAEWPGIAAYRGYRNALLAAQGEAALTAKALKHLLSALRESDRLVVISGKLGSNLPQLNDRHVGVSLEHKGERVIGVLDSALVQLAGDRQIARSLIKLLGTRGAYAGGQGHAGTSQIGRPLIIKGTLVQKPRFWLFRAKALAALAKATDSQEQRSVSRL